jgi:hypothetical protein
MKTTPLAQVKERFGSKENLVQELRKLFDKTDLFENRLNPDKGLLRVANSKLLKLHDVATEVKERFTTRANLIDDLLQLLGRQKDEQYKESLGRWGLPRLWDYYRSVAKKRG